MRKNGKTIGTTERSYTRHGESAEKLVTQPEGSRLGRWMDMTRTMKLSSEDSVELTEPGISEKVEIREG